MPIQSETSNIEAHVDTYMPTSTSYNSVYEVCTDTYHDSSILLSRMIGLWICEILNDQRLRSYKRLMYVFCILCKGKENKLYGQVFCRKVFMFLGGMSMFLENMSIYLVK